MSEFQHKAPQKSLYSFQQREQLAQLVGYLRRTGAKLIRQGNELLQAADSLAGDRPIPYTPTTKKD